MKTLVKPLMVLSFVVMCAGLVPGVPFAMAVLGFASMALTGAAGVFLLGSEDRDYLSQLELIRLEHAKAVDLTTMTLNHATNRLEAAQKAVNDAEKKFTEIENRCSSALAEVRRTRPLG